ncbi:type IX secretion system motor protein PorM/GldM [Mucilaginibacter pedocola]|uniref:Gliding motility protein GldM n=1 Tax=Mucilaginibacter pedocola TaxID=1792845 RepID=A0A1S9PEH8_9SPHI|nr:gliding motility protein GldM [Mucilaginibacter pedocola]OOQ59018.1 gliding motility protein GldM [Mucilaginibacter pedocola]
MAGGKETPRQRMIGILYLVLLGLIALNVPDSLLDAFKNITNSLNTSSKNVTTGIENTYDAFEKTKLKEQPERAKPVYEKAKQASAAANELSAYIDQLTDLLIKEGGGINPEIDDVDARDNLDISPRVMITDKNADQLRAKIDATREKLLSLLTDKERTGVNLSLVANDPPKGRDGQKTWQQGYFGDGIPLGAALTTLAKIKADTKNAENEVVKKILGEVDQAVVNLDKFSAVAVAPSSYIIAGQPYTAEVFLTASDSKSSPSITVNGSSLAVADGRGKYSVNTGSEGVFTWVGKINVKQTDGTMKEYSTAPQTYQVARPSAVVSPDKMNVLYIGVPNPISVSAPGIPKEKLHVSISGGSVSGSGGKYTATVNNAGNATVSVSGELAPGKSQVLGSTEFRVKRIPDPKPQFAGKSSGSTSAANLRGQDKVFARLENFEFDATFNVTRFSMIIIKPRQDALRFSTSGAELSSAMKAGLAGVVPGTTVVIQDIIAVGPDGTQRGLDAIVLTAN